MKTTMLAALALAPLLAACPSSAPPAPVTVVPVDLGGDWFGTWESADTGATGQVRMSLAFVSPNAIGSGAFTGGACVWGFNDVAAFVDSSRIVTGTMRDPFGGGTARVEFVGVISDDSLSLDGSYFIDAPTSPCDDDAGTLTMDKAIPLRTVRSLTRVYTY